MPVKLIFTRISEHPDMNTALSEAKNMAKQPNDISKNEDKLKEGDQLYLEYTKYPRGDKLTNTVRLIEEDNAKSNGK